MRTIMTNVYAAIVLMLFLAHAAARAEPGSPEEVADALHRALGAGDAAAVRALLHDDVLIFESGGAESSAAEYAAHHLGADMAFSRGMTHTRLARSARTLGDGAWVATRSRTQGRFKDKDIDLDNTETLVLERRDGAWRIAHIHWSSAPHRDSAH